MLTFAEVKRIQVMRYMVLDRLFPSGAIVITGTGTKDGKHKTQRYYDYSVREAKRLFKQLP